MASTAALVAASDAVVGCSKLVTLEEKLTIRPAVRRRRAASRRVLNVPFRLTAMWRSNSASPLLAMVARFIMPALFDQHVDAAATPVADQHACPAATSEMSPSSRHGPAAGLISNIAAAKSCAALFATVKPFALGNRGADTAEAPGDDGNWIRLGGHDFPPTGLASR